MLAAAEVVVVVTADLVVQVVLAELEVMELITEVKLATPQHGVVDQMDMDVITIRVLVTL